MKKLAIAGCGGMVYDFIYEYTKTLDVKLGVFTDYTVCKGRRHFPKGNAGL